MERWILWEAVSSAVQADVSEESLPDQDARLRAACAANGGRVVDVIRIPGFSRVYYNYYEFMQEAAADKRVDARDALRMVDHWKARDFDVFAFTSGDRFGREQSLFAEIVARCIDGGARMLSLRDGWITRENKRMFIMAAGYTASAEIDELRRRHEMGVRGRLARGLPASNALGTHRVIRDQRGKAVRAEVREELRRLFDDIFDLLVNERTAFGAMEAALEQRGHGRVGASTVRNWLRSPTFWGHGTRRHVDHRFNHAWHWVYDDSVQPPDGVLIYRNVGPAVYSGQQAMLLKAELNRRLAQRGSTRPYNTGRYSGLIICRKCGTTMHYRSAADYSPNRAYYLCNRRELGGCVPRVWLPEKNADAALSRVLLAVLAGIDFAEYAGDKAPAQASVIVLREEVGQLEGQIARLIDKQATAPEAVASIYDERIQESAARLQILRAQVAQHAGESLSELDSRAHTVEYLNTHGMAAFWALPTARQHQLISALLGPYRLIADGRDVVGIARP